MDNVISFLVIGGLAGWLANLLLRGKGMGCLGNVLIGILGALIGGLVFNALDLPVGSGWVWSLFTALVGAMLLLFVARLLKSD
jgi:uncharacterized membrane protein YeaQ/YmgE (transglycosylase-associated protein family)